jgi:uncharacterized membrane protein
LDSRVPKLIFVFLVLYAAVHFSSVYPQLPGMVASHFNSRGAPNGWQTKQSFFGVFVTVSVLAVVIGFGMPKLIAAVPAQLINLPNKRYWLAPRHLAETTEFLSNYFAWFACAIYLTMVFAFDYAIQGNLHPENPPDPARMWYVLAGFVTFALLGTIRLLAKFLRPPPEP